MESLEQKAERLEKAMKEIKDSSIKAISEREDLKGAMLQILNISLYHLDPPPSDLKKKSC